MRKIFCILCISLPAIGHAQDAAGARRIADGLFASGLYEQALVEYERALFFNDTATGTINARMGLCEYRTGNFASAFDHFRAAEILAENDSLAAEFRFMQAEMQINAKKYNEALAIIEYTRIPESIYLEKKKLLYLSFTRLLNDDFSGSEQSFTDYTSRFASCKSDELQQLFHQHVKKIKQVKPGTAYVMSLVVPGSGQAYAGKPLNGLNSLVLNGAIVFLMYRVFVVYGPIPSLLILASPFTRYYTGGASRAKHFAADKRNGRKEKALKELSIAVESSVCK